MLSPPKTSIFRQESHQPGTVVWFISFGDLLTLLLCFFLVLTPWKDLAKRSDTAKKQEVSDALGSQGAVGITLAAVPAREEPRTVAEVPLYDELVGSRDGVAEAQVLVALEQAFESLADVKELATEVEVCGAGDVREEVSARVVPLVSGARFSLVPLRVIVAAQCEAAHDGTRQRVGSIRLKGI